MPTCRYRHLTSPDEAPLHDLEVVRITPVSPPRHVPVIPTLDSIGFTANNPKARISDIGRITNIGFFENEAT